MAISACASPLSSNRRIEPAVAVKASLRPGRSSVCLVTASGGSLRCSAVAADDGGLAARPPPPFGAAGAAAAGVSAGAASSARALTTATPSRAAKQRERKTGIAMRMICFLPPPATRPKSLGHSQAKLHCGACILKLRHVHAIGKPGPRERIETAQLPQADHAVYRL